MCRFIQYIVLYASFCAPYREFGEHWENLKSFRDWYSVMSTQLKKGREEDLKEGLETGL